MTPGKQLDELHGELQRTHRAWHAMFVARRIKRSTALAAIGEARAVLDRMERIITGAGP